ncbi:MAG: hypothetical protein AB8B63_21010 [Granulosicoccus sp.]
MYRLLSKIGSAFQEHYLKVGRARARDVLLRQSDRVLIDAGFSRELLEKGVSAWPWQLEVAQAIVQTSVRSTEQTEAKVDSLSRAIEELSAYTDKELADIGVARSSIADAVRFGRPGIDIPAGDIQDHGDTRHAA